MWQLYFYLFILFPLSTEVALCCITPIREKGRPIGRLLAGLLSERSRSQLENPSIQAPPTSTFRRQILLKKKQRYRKGEHLWKAVSVKEIMQKNLKRKKK